jgi:hypothetical protein
MTIADGSHTYIRPSAEQLHRARRRQLLTRFQYTKISAAPLIPQSVHNCFAVANKSGMSF